MSKNLCLITSVVNTPNLPLSYISSRSIYTWKQRYEQTIQTLSSIKEKIPNVKIFLIECSEFKEDDEKYLINNCDYYLNLYNNEKLQKNIFGVSKSLGEGTMTIQALNFIISNDIKFNNMFKISGRYFLSKKFDYNKFNNENIVVKKIEGNINNIFTALYKLNEDDIVTFKIFLEKNIENMKNCIGYEILFGMYLKHINYKNVLFIDNYIGLKGYVSGCGSEYDG